MTTLDPYVPVPHYPLVVPGDTLMNDDQLIRYIGEHCCEDVANVVWDIITCCSMKERINGHLRSALDSLMEADTAVSDAKTELRQLASIL